MGLQDTRQEQRSDPFMIAGPADLGKPIGLATAQNQA
jgi:hypothetical protein